MTFYSEIRNVGEGAQKSIGSICDKFENKQLQKKTDCFADSSD